MRTGTGEADASKKTCRKHLYLNDTVVTWVPEPDDDKPICWLCFTNRVDTDLCWALLRIDALLDAFYEERNFGAKPPGPGATLKAIREILTAAFADGTLTPGDYDRPRLQRLMTRDLKSATKPCRCGR